MKSNRLLFVLLLMFTSLVSCDIEDKIRRLASDPQGRKRDSLKPKEVSSRLAESEPNGTLATANSITLTKELREISGSFSESDLADWFSITFPESGEYEIIVTPTSELDVSLFLEKGDYVFNRAQKGGVESVKSPLVSAFRFGIKREQKTEGLYKIRVVKFERKTNIELEPNNQTSTATHLVLKKGMVGKIDQVGDRDVFKIIGAKYQRWELQVLPSEDDLLTLKFCDDIELLSCSRIYLINKETLRIPAFGLPSKTKPLYAVVGSAKPSKRYQILALPLSNAETEIEPNDSFAMEIHSEEPDVSFDGYLKDEDDIDRFQVLNWKNYAYQLQVIDPDLTLKVDGRAVVASQAFHSCSKATDDIIELKFDRRKDRPVFQGADYRISFTEQSMDFEQEPNSNQESGQPLRELGGNTSSEDIDFFVFDGGTEPKEYNLLNRSTDDIHVSIIDDEGFDVLAKQAIAPSKTLKLKFDFPQGRYFVKIVGQSESCSPYKFSVAKTL